MGRMAKKRRPPRVKPVERVALSEKRIGLRAAAAVLFLLIGAGAFAYFFVNLVRGEVGWTEIQVSSSAPTCGGDFTFLYEIGAEGGFALREKRAVTAAYTEAARRAYELFENGGADDGRDRIGVRFLNDHPNQAVAVDEALYQAFSKLEEAQCRLLYLPAVYQVYDQLFASPSDLAAAEFDPRANQAVSAYVREALRYANDPESVRLELLGDNRVRLFVSRQYLDFARENELESFIDFYWMKNGFVADYLAQAMREAGFTNGSLSSCDGFVRCLDGRGLQYAFPIYDRDQEAAERILRLGNLVYSGPLSLVWFRDFPSNDRDSRYFYQMADGQTRTAYIDPADGLCRSAVSSLTAYAYGEETGCADVLLAMVSLYMAEDFSKEGAESLAEGPRTAVYSVFCQDGVIWLNDPRARLEDLLSGYTVGSYRTSVLSQERKSVIISTGIQPKEFAEGLGDRGYSL